MGNTVVWKNRGTKEKQQLRCLVLLDVEENKVGELSEAVEDASLNCYEVIKESWQEPEGLLAIKEGLAELTRNFRLASKFHDTNKERKTEEE
ncbi:hypothetical protein Vadar_015629 [Vaccinium darrowii]|uniref:Uncharacterized protein n=1 Tax=Vaccinium darrowii TaxID=229202 RepID=A0ACB7XHS4_9ERIC|nr:hypothetical protein Vadar_015629 [Vaccinium darrowii]